MNWTLSVCGALSLAACLSLGASVGLASDFRTEFKRMESDSEAYPFKPSASLIFTNSDHRINTLLHKAFYSDIQREDGRFLHLYEATIDNNSPLTVKKNNPFTYLDADFYAESFGRQLFDCINHYPAQDSKEDTKINHFAKFLIGIPTTQDMTRSEFVKFIRDMKPRADKVFGYYRSVNQNCPSSIPDNPRLELDDGLPGAANVIRSVVYTGWNRPNSKWTVAARDIFFEFVASEEGLWYQETRKEMQEIVTEAVRLNAFPASYIDDLAPKGFTDFLEFTRSFRDHLKTKQMSARLAKSVGTSCLTSVAEAFEPFSLKACMDAGKLEAVPTGNPGTVFLVPGPSALTSTDDQGE